MLMLNFFPPNFFFLNFYFNAENLGGGDTRVHEGGRLRQKNKLLQVFPVPTS